MFRERSSLFVLLVFLLVLAGILYTDLKEQAHHGLEKREKQRKRLRSSSLLNDTRVSASSPGGTTNFASAYLGATLVDFNRVCKGVSSILNDDREKYMICPCSAPRKQFTVQLIRDIELRIIGITNYEHFSSGVRNFTLLGSQRYPTNHWYVIGEFAAEHRRGTQLFQVEQQPPIRFLRFQWVTSHENQDWCTMSRVQAFGVDVLDALAENYEVDVAPIEEPESAVESHAGSSSARGSKKDVEEARLPVSSALSGTSSSPPSSTNKPGHGLESPPTSTFTLPPFTLDPLAVDVSICSPIDGGDTSKQRSSGEQATLEAPPVRFNTNAPSSSKPHGEAAGNVKDHSTGANGRNSINPTDTGKCSSTDLAVASRRAPIDAYDWRMEVVNLLKSNESLSGGSECAVQDANLWKWYHHVAYCPSRRLLGASFLPSARATSTSSGAKTNVTSNETAKDRGTTKPNLPASNNQTKKAPQQPQPPVSNSVGSLINQLGKQQRNLQVEVVRLASENARLMKEMVSLQEQIQASANTNRELVQLAVVYQDRYSGAARELEVLETKLALQLENLQMSSRTSPVLWIWLCCSNVVAFLALSCTFLSSRQTNVFTLPRQAGRGTGIAQRPNALLNRPTSTVLQPMM